MDRELLQSLAQNAGTCHTCQALQKIPTENECDEANLAKWEWDVKEHLSRYHKPFVDDLFEKFQPVLPYMRCEYHETCVTSLKQRAKEVVAIMPGDSVALFYYTVAIRKARTEGLSNVELSVLYANRSQMQLTLRNFEFALSDSLQARALDPSNYKAAFRHAVSSQRLGLWKDCQKICAQALCRDEWHTVRQHFQKVLIEARDQIGAEPSHSAPAKPPSVKCGGPAEHQSDSDFIKCKSKLIDGHVLLLQSNHCTEASVRFAEVLKLVADSRFEDSFQNHYGRVRCMQSFGKDLADLLTDKPHNFCPSEMLPVFFDSCTEDDCAWWWSYMHKQARQPGNWSVSALQAWHRCPSSWRSECMTKAIVKLCQEVDCLDDPVCWCPEIHAASLDIYSQIPSKFIDLAKLCSVSEHDHGSIGGVFVPRKFWLAENANRYMKVFTEYAKVALHTQKKDALEFVTAWQQSHRWEVLVTFCYMSLTFCLCEEEQMTIVVPKEKPSTYANCSMRTDNKNQFCKSARKDGARLQNASRDPFDWTVYSRSCLQCRNRNARLKCERCFKTLGVSVYYCSKACQKVDWESHKTFCGKSMSAIFSEEQPSVEEHEQILGDICSIAAELEREHLGSSTSKAVLKRFRCKYPDTLISHKHVKQILKDTRQANG